MRTVHPRTVILALCLATLVLASLGCSDSGISAPTAPESSRARASDLVVPIQVAPATLIIDSPGTWVTVHAEIAYSEVDSATVVLNGVSPRIVTSDNRGELVGKFDRADIASIVSPPEAVLTLNGTTISGTPFSGSDTIAVQ